MVEVALRRRAVGERDAIDVALALREDADDARRTAFRVDDFVADLDRTHRRPPARRQDLGVERLRLGKSGAWDGDERRVEPGRDRLRQHRLAGARRAEHEQAALALAARALERLARLP